jgi:hypothetical protein
MVRTAISIRCQAKFIILELKRERLDPKISVKLEGIDLWKRFNSMNTEMIITK